MRALLIIGRILLSILLTGAVIFSTNVAPFIGSIDRSYANTSQAVVKTRMSPLKSLIEERHRLIGMEVTQARYLTADDKKGKANTVEINKLRSVVVGIITKMADPFEVEADIAFLPELLEPTDDEWFDEKIAATKAEASGRINELTTSVTNWQEAVKIENARIEEEERIKREAEERARAEAAARKNAGGGGGSYSSGGGSGNRLQRIADSLPFSFNWAIGPSCGDRTLGCYRFDGVIYITAYGATKSDCKIREVFAHEYRHWQQHVGGLVEPGVANRDWLESDASSFGWRYGC